MKTRKGIAAGLEPRLRPDDPGWSRPRPRTHRSARRQAHMPPMPVAPSIKGRGRLSAASISSYFEFGTALKQSQRAVVRCRPSLLRPSCGALYSYHSGALRHPSKSGMLCEQKISTSCSSASLMTRCSEASARVGSRWRFPRPARRWLRGRAWWPTWAPTARSPARSETAPPRRCRPRPWPRSARGRSPVASRGGHRDTARRHRPGSTGGGCRLPDPSRASDSRDCC